MFCEESIEELADGGDIGDFIGADFDAELGLDFDQHRDHVDRVEPEFGAEIVAVLNVGELPADAIDEDLQELSPQLIPSHSCILHENPRDPRFGNTKSRPPLPAEFI